MKTSTYIAKHGSVYGISSKCAFGRWDHVLYAFQNTEEAEKWLRQEEYDFRERELCSKTRAIELMGTTSFINELERIGY